MNLIIQSCMYLLFVMGAFYFGGVSTLGTNAITTAAAVLAFGCVVAYTIKRVRSRDACEFHYGGPAGVALLIWILVLGISVYFSVYKAASFAAFAQFAGYFIIFMIILNVFDEAATMSFVRILFILGVALSLFGIAGYAMRSTVLFS
ncbi:MAG: hypothetical protein JW938_04475, partial [Candidatus Omnitrophica bacterium]|nr:hypothetical protein [Candidatus Omnitrophota bacterium]